MRSLAVTSGPWERALIPCFLSESSTPAAPAGCGLPLVLTALSANNNRYQLIHHGGVLAPRQFSIASSSSVELSRPTRCRRIRSDEGGLVSMARSIAADLAPRNIRVNVVAPGATKTPIWKRGPRLFEPCRHPTGVETSSQSDTVP